MAPSTDAIQVEEYRVLRAELNDNRKYIFERPLLIVGATLAATFSLSGSGRLGLLPLPFLAILLFNLWFTYNRVQSSARIIAYLQLVHEGQRPEFPWLGWENALRRYRIRLARKDPKPSDVRHREGRRSRQMAYYAPIFYFHLVLGGAVTLTLLGSSEIAPNVYDRVATNLEIGLLVLNGSCFLLFAASFLLFRPRRVRHAIAFQRHVWRQVLSTPTPADAGPDSVPLAEGGRG